MAVSAAAAAPPAPTVTPTGMPAAMPADLIKKLSVTCAVCRCPGLILSMDERGWRIGHPGRLFPCRAPR